MIQKLIAALRKAGPRANVEQAKVETPPRSLATPCPSQAVPVDKSQSTRSPDSGSRAAGECETTGLSLGAVRSSDETRAQALARVGKTPENAVKAPALHCADRHEETQNPIRAVIIHEFPQAVRRYVVQRTIEEGSVTAVVATPNAGKTALMVHLGVHLAAQASEWLGRKSNGGPVIYIAAEAPGSVVMRARAAIDRHFPGARVPFYVVASAPALGDSLAGDVEATQVMATIRHVEATEGTPVRAVIIDVLASCLGDGDENGDGMRRLSAKAKRIAIDTGVAVILVHHPSKGDSAGLRGHSSLQAACDAILSISVDREQVRTATLTKSRDNATGQELQYELDVVELDELDSFGDVRTTVVVKPTTRTATRARPKGSVQLALLEEIERRSRCGETSWDERTARDIGRAVCESPYSAARALSALKASGYVVEASGRLTLAHPPEGNS
jgi:KaiC/GvpD/RAD55 family RecA-like ATPase